MISVIIPSYNYAKYLPEAITSVAKQTYGDWELVVVDDGSTDKSAKVAVDTIKTLKIADRASVISKENGGLVSARKVGFAKSSGDYVMFLDADDVLHKQYLSKTAKVLDNSYTTDIVYTDYTMFGSHTRTHHQSDFTVQGLLGGCIITNSALFRRECFFPYLATEYRTGIGGEDWDFWLGCIERGHIAYRLPESLLYYRVHGSSLTRKADLDFFSYLVIRHKKLYPTQMFESAVQRVRENHPEYLEEPWLSNYL